MPKLPRVSAQRAVHALERLGFTQARQQGSHVILKNELPKVRGAVSCRCITSWPLARFEGF